MSLYLIIYLFVIISLLCIGFLVYKKYKKTLHGKYLTISIVCFALWLIVYVASFSTTYDPIILGWMSKLGYALSMIAIYSMIFFALFYSDTYKKNKPNKINKIIILILGILTLLTLFTPLILEGMIFDPKVEIYRESFGSLFGIYSLLHIFNPIIFTVVSFIKIKKLKGIAKTRFKYISIGYGIFIYSFVIFLGILPVFEVRLLQKEQILFFIPFIICVWYSIHRYYFLDPLIGIGRIFIFINALLFSSLLTGIIYDHYTLKLSSVFGEFWGIKTNFHMFSISMGVVLFFITYSFLTKKLLISSNHNSFIEKLENIQSKIPFITNFNDVNNFLKKSFTSSFNISDASIKLIDHENKEENELYKFFKDNIKNSYFLNDVVFIEENRNKFNKKKIKKKISKNLSLILPIKKGDNIIGFFNLGNKPLKDNYSSEQIKQLKKFTDFLTGHIKYLNIYKDIHELNINLDKKVDEKTMEYNNLISKQKEFISVVSHEMRSPITTAIFQTDCIIDDVESGKTEKEYLEKELKSLYTQLTRSSDLVKKLFSVEKYDINKFSLFKENIDLNNFLESEIYHFSKNNPNIYFDIDIEKNLGSIEIDQVQFRQVIDNLINNAIKFADVNKPKISLSAKKQEKTICIRIEDNGKGFQDTDITSIFDKYFTGESSGIGIGIGLYLCKKIVEFHDGKIEASFSKKIGGGKFIITIPK